MVGVGIDFVFPLEEEEGRKNNPHLGSTIGSEATCLKFLVGVWKVYGNCLEGALNVSRKCFEGIWIVSGW